MKDLSEDVVHSFPGFEKLLEPFKSTGDAKVKKDLVSPKDAPHYSANSKASDVDNREPKMADAYEPPKVSKKKNKKARKKLKESINNFRSNTMKSQKNKFDELFENVMGEEDLDMTLDTDGAGDMEIDADLDSGMGGLGSGGNHGDLHQKIEDIITALNDLKSALGSEEAGEDEGFGDEDEGEEDLSDADEGALDEEGMETPEEAIVSEPEPRLHNPQPAINAMTNTKGKTQPTASGYAASTGKADNGKVPNIQADPKAHNPQPAINAMTNTKGKTQPNSKLNKPGQELFQV